MSERADTWILGLDGAAGWTLGLEEILLEAPRLDVRRSTMERDPRRGFGPRVDSLLAGRPPRLIIVAASGRQTDDALELLRCLTARPACPPVVAAIEHGLPDQIYELLAAGAADFVTPPLEAAQIMPRVRRLLELAAAPPAAKLKRRLRTEIGLRQLIGESPAFCEETRKIPLVAGCDVSVLICGETGTGKDLVARAIHYLSPRASGAFVALNCGAVPVDLLENELFGHGRAAFTGASSAAPGLVQEAEGGTLFLDEVACMPLPAQAKLLRFLQDRQYRPLGSTRLRSADVRVLAATNADPEEAVAAETLRRDLYYRLNVIQLNLPPLRRRPEDIPLLAEHFLAKYVRRFDKPLTGLSPGVSRGLVLHTWPGNVRELEHVIERAVVLCEHGDLLRRADLDLPRAGGAARPTSFREAKAKVIADFERNYVRGLLRACNGNISQAARTAKKDRKSFWQLLRKHNIDARSFKR